MNNYLYLALRSIYVKFINLKCYQYRRKYISPMEKCLKRLAYPEEVFCSNSSYSDKSIENKAKVSVISSNCFAGRIMQDLKMEYNSPTLGLYFMYPDYIEFLKNLKFYLTEAKIDFVEHSKYPLGDERRANWSHWYPIGLLDGKVEIHFLHYHTEAEAAEKWYRRSARVNFENLLIIGMQQNLCSQKDIIEFNSLPFTNKIIFTSTPISGNSIEYMEEFANEESVGDPYRKAHLFYKHFLKHFS